MYGFLDVKRFNAILSEDYKEKMHDDDQMG